jgi:hypothetical protein
VVKQLVHAVGDNLVWQGDGALGAVLFTIGAVGTIVRRDERGEPGNEFESSGWTDLDTIAASVAAVDIDNGQERFAAGHAFSLPGPLWPIFSKDSPAVEDKSHDFCRLKDNGPWGVLDPTRADARPLVAR